MLHIYNMNVNDPVGHPLFPCRPQGETDGCDLQSSGVGPVESDYKDQISQGVFTPVVLVTAVQMLQFGPDIC